VSDITDSDFSSLISQSQVHSQFGDLPNNHSSSVQSKIRLTNRSASDGPPNGSSALTPVATRMREQDADAIAQFMGVLKRGNTGTPNQVVDTGNPAPSPFSKRGLGDVRSGGLQAMQQLRQTVSTASLKPSNSITTAHSTHSAAPASPDDGEASEAATPRASGEGFLAKHESITPPASRRSPFAILTRVTKDDSRHRRTISNDKER